MTIGNYFQIGGQAWNVRIIEVTENFSILFSENTGRTMTAGARMSLDPLGTFVGHKIVVARNGNTPAAIAAFDSLFNYLKIPRYNGIPVKCADGQTAIEYDAYVSAGERKLTRIDLVSGTVYWDTFSINIVPMEAQVLPQ